MDDGFESRYLVWLVREHLLPDDAGADEAEVIAAYRTRNPHLSELELQLDLFDKLKKHILIRKYGRLYIGKDVQMIPTTSEE